MNGTKSPDAALPSTAQSAAANNDNGNTQPGPAMMNAHGSSSDAPGSPVLPDRPNGIASKDVEAVDEGELPDAPPPVPAAEEGLGDGDAHGSDDGDRDSEAETLITSPVKKREAMKKVDEASVNVEPTIEVDMHQPHDEPQIEAEDADAPGSPDDAIRTIHALPINPLDMKNDENPESDKENSSESLSEMSSRSSSSRASSRSRALSEHSGNSRLGVESPNPRKRKHRASLISKSNKRSSIDGTKRPHRLAHEAGHGELSPAPKVKSHRRAVSTQSASYEGPADPSGGSGRKRRAASQFPVLDPKAHTWEEESSVSSETASHGHSDQRRPKRGVGRSTSTPGRPVGREHKRHVNKYGFTRLAEACESGDLDLVKVWRDKDPDQLELAEFAGNKPLQIASLNGNAEVVEYLIDQGCQVDCANVDKDTPLIDAAENGHVDCVRILLKAGVDPLRQNLKGQQALDVLHEKTDNVDEIRAALRKAVEKWSSDDAKQRREEEEMQRFRAGPAKELHFMARTYENLLKLVTINDRTGVREFLDARVPVDNAIIAAAAKTGDLYLVNMLLAEMTEKKAYQKPEKPMLSVLGSSHFEMVKSLTELEQYNPLYRNRQGKSWPQIAEEKQGPNWRQEKELLQQLYDEANCNVNRGSSSPVTKRDGNGKWRPPARRNDADNSDEDEAPKRKKRLMSRKDMRAVSQRALSDSSSEDESSETAATGVDESMRPPESPASKRPASRQRRNSMSAQPTQPEVPRMRRRSSSFRGPGEIALPSVDEVMEDVGVPALKTEKSTTEHKGVREVELKRKEEEVAARAKKAEEEARRAEGERKAAVERKKEEEKKAADERKKAEERKAESARQAEEARKQEEAWKIENDRQVEEERKRKATNEQKKRQHWEGFIQNTIPASLSWMFDPRSDFSYNNRPALEWMLQNWTPLQAVQHKDIASNNSEDQLDSEWDWDMADSPPDELFVLNLQAAPLMGKRGFELLLKPSAPGIDDALGARWASLPWLEDHASLAQHILQTYSLCKESFQQTEDDVMVDGEDPGSAFLTELKKTAERRSSVLKELGKLSMVSLRWVRLTDVLDNLHPALKGVPVQIRSDLRTTTHFTRMSKVIASQSTEGDLFENMRAWQRGNDGSPKSFVSGELVRDRSSGKREGRTEVVVVNEK